MSKTNHIPTIIFDFGGVLLDWDPRHLYREIFQGDEQAMEQFLAEVKFYEWNLQQDAGRPFAQAVEEHCQLFPHYCELLRAYDSRWEASIAGVIQPVVDQLEALKQNCYSLVGFSNWSAEKFQLVRHKYHFMDWFETIIISGEVNLVKPDPRIFKLLLERIQRPAQACLFIDDSASNIITAQQLGFQTIHFQSPEQLEAELHRMGVNEGKV